ncbi:MAG: TRAP transporter small permease [Pseudomonadota bacterium]
MTAAPKSAIGRLINEIEESLIAILLGLMTIVTFANVVVRYGFNGNILWALETTVFLFAWMVLLGASYCVKINAHLGVDALLNVMPAGMRRAVTIFAALCCITFAVLLFIGSWNYWYPFVTTQAWYETDDVPMPAFLQFLSDIFNEGERYEKIPRFIPYFIMPLSTALLSLRFLQAGWRIVNGSQLMLIASHEAEDMVEEASRKAEAEEAAQNNANEGTR